MIPAPLLGSVSSVREEYSQHQFYDDLLPLFIQHSRLEGVAELQDRVIKLYLAAAVRGAENATNRDILLRAREWRCSGVARFEHRRGAWADVTCLVDGSAFTDFVVEGDTGPKTWGFSVAAPSSAFGMGALTGYATFDDLPADLVSFILSLAALQYEIREVATYQTVVQHADVLPLYLIDTWTIPTYA